MQKFFLQLRDLNWWGRAAAVGCLFSFFILFNAKARESLQSYFRPDDRIVLSRLSGNLLAKEYPNLVVKLSTPTGILVEVYGQLKDSSRSLVDTIQIADRHDGYVHLMGQAVNLALKDMDGDRMPEIVAPTYDAQMKPHLNVFKYNQQIQRFEPYLGADH